MNILVINAGSSSLKYKLIEIESERLIAKGIVERVGTRGSNLQHTPNGKEKIKVSLPIRTHEQAIEIALKALTNEEYGAINDLSEIRAIGHRVAHGGERFVESVLITNEVREAIIDNSVLAPIHNPACVLGIDACKNIMPNTPQVAVFDTSFHQTMPPKAYLYGLPYSYYKEDKIRRYGFHGTSHRYIAQTLAKALDMDINQLKIISCHLGNGSSVAAIDGGKSVDTSMGMTPLEGLLMGTRCGDLDPSIIEYIMKSKKMTIEQVMSQLNKASGILGVSKISADMRDIEDSVAKGEKRAVEAYDLFCYKVIKYIGAYAAVMNGVDFIVFTAGIGENSWMIRRDILKQFQYLGLEVDDKRNVSGGEMNEVTTDSSKVKAYTVATNEELMIARDTCALVRP